MNLGSNELLQIAHCKATHVQPCQCMQILYPYYIYDFMGVNKMPDQVTQEDDDETCGKCFEGECCQVEDEEEEWDNYD